MVAQQTFTNSALFRYVQRTPCSSVSNSPGISSTLRPLTVLSASRGFVNEFRRMQSFRLRDIPSSHHSVSEVMAATCITSVRLCTVHEFAFLGGMLRTTGQRRNGGKRVLSTPEGYRQTELVIPRHGKF